MFFFSSRRRHTRCALVTGVQTCALPIWTASRADVPPQPSSTHAGIQFQRISGQLRMIEFYPHIRQIHILTVILSGGLFALRGVFALAGARWPHAAPVRYLSYTIDTTLLTAALMLVSILPRSEEHTSELQSLMRISYAVFCLKKK